jgi:hypothetical protein
MAMDTILVFQSEPKLKISTGPNNFPLLYLLLHQFERNFTGMFISYYFTEVEMFGTDWKFNMATRPAI